MWDITLHSPLKVSRHFGGICYLHLQGWRVSKAWCLLHADFLLGSLFNPENGGNVFLQNVSWLSRDYKALCPRRLNSSKLNILSWFVSWKIAGLFKLLKLQQEIWNGTECNRYFCFTNWRIFYNINVINIVHALINSHL
jgi:hypothetical protein